MRKWLMAAGMLPAGLMLVCTWGCARRSELAGGYQTVAKDPRRDTETARAQNARAVQGIQKERWEEAEKALKTALTADLFYGPAHNNLGLVYYHQEKFYLAAWEFQYAAKLMPHSPEPRNNLGLVYEAVGRLEEAEKWFDKALALEPDNPQLVGNLARVLVRSNRKDEKTRRLLGEIVLKDTRPDWVNWARERLVMMGQPDQLQATPSAGKPVPSK